MADEVCVIEPLEPRWEPAEAQQLYDQIRSEIARIYTAPDWALSRPDAFMHWHAQARAAAEPLVKTAAELYCRYTVARMLIKST